MSKPLFSIICPIYNKESTINETINSLLKQNLFNIEFILVDDHSSDRTVSILKHAAKNDKRIKLFTHKQNLGVHQARTTGVQNASGKFILFLDGDDSLEINACSILKEAIESTDSDVIEFDYYIVPGKKVHSTSYDSRDRVTALLSEENSYPATIWNKLYKTTIVKKAFSNTPYIPQNGPEDLFEAIMMAFYSKSYYHLDTPLYNYSFGQGVSTRKRNLLDNETYFKNMKYVIDITSDFFKQKKSKYLDLIPQFEKRLVRDAVEWFINTLTIHEDVNKSYLLLPKYFSLDAVLPYFENLKNMANKYINGRWNITGFIRFLKTTFISH